jgi:hypothetical protein
MRRLEGHTGQELTRALLTMEQVQDQTGVRQQQVSRWRKSLKDKPKYRERQKNEKSPLPFLPRGRASFGRFNALTTLRAHRE